MSNTSAKYKIDRRIGKNVSGRNKSPVFQRSVGLGQHGSKKKRRVSEYGLKTLECAKIKRMYGDIRTKALKRVINEAMVMPGRKDDNIACLLELRLDNIVRDAKFAVSPFAARQLVSHKNILVNGKIVNIASYRVKVGDIITLADHMKQNIHVKNAIDLNEREVPSYLQVQGFECKVISLPNASNDKFSRLNVNFNFLIEFLAS